MLLTIPPIQRRLSLLRFASPPCLSQQSGACSDSSTILKEEYNV